MVHVCACVSKGTGVTAVTGQIPLSRVSLLQEETSLISPIPPLTPTCSET